MEVLVIAEHDNQQLKASTRAALGAALILESRCQVLVMGHECQSVANEAASYQGVEKVLWVDKPHLKDPLAENMAPILVALKESFTHFVACASTFGKNLMPRAAAQMGVAQVSDITEVVSADTFVRPVYASNAFAKVQSLDPIKVITVRQTHFDGPAQSNTLASIESLDAGQPHAHIAFEHLEHPQSERPELTQAKVVVSGGRGLKSKENFKLIESLADKLGAAVGASRAAVDAGFVANDCQVGQTGKVVAPVLYVAVGISGAIQHLAGMTDSKVIVAINQDPQAPIFEVADYGLVGDLFEILPQIMEKL